MGGAVVFGKAKLLGAHTRFVHCPPSRNYVTSFLAHRPVCCAASFGLDLPRLSTRRMATGAATYDRKECESVITSAGVRMPRMIYGTAWKVDRTTDLVYQAFRHGFTGVDTACQPKHYREDLVGDALAKLQAEGMQRENIFLQTKFTPFTGQDPANCPYDPALPLTEQVLRSSEVSLVNLKTSYVDSLVLHSPCKTHSETMEVWRAFEQLVEKGVARQLGISNCYDLLAFQNLYRDAVVKPAVVQNRFYAKSSYDEELRRWCAQNGVIYQSFWTLTGNPDILKSDVVQQIARERSCTPAEVFFRFVLDQGICPLTGTKTAEHMLQDLQVLRDLPLTGGEQEAIAALMFGSGRAGTR